MKKIYFDLSSIVYFSIILNIILYFLKWSSYIEGNTLDFSTILIIDYILLACILGSCISKSPFTTKINGKRIILKKAILNLGNIKLDIYSLINIAYICLILLENYLGSGTIIPALEKIDIHTYSAPIISFFTRNLFVILFLNYLCYENFRKRKYVIYCIIHILLFIVLRNARMVIFVSIIQVIIFYFIYNFKFIRENKIKVIKIIILFFMICSIGVGMGKIRMNHYGKYDLKYGDAVLYTGPTDKLEILPWYYGYFPMSVLNLDLTVKNIKNYNDRTYGIYSLRPILVGIFELDNIISGYPDIDYSNKYRKYLSTSATVPTGFIEFFLDFGDMCILSILFYFLIGVYFYNSIRKNIYYLSYYAIYSGSWAFMSFQNTLIEPVLFYGILFLYLIRIVFVRERN